MAGAEEDADGEGHDCEDEGVEDDRYGAGQGLDGADALMRCFGLLEQRVWCIGWVARMGLGRKLCVAW